VLVVALYLSEEEPNNKISCHLLLVKILSWNNSGGIGVTRKRNEKERCSQIGPVIGHEQEEKRWSPKDW
jgi:hypothetical protein